MMRQKEIDSGALHEQVLMTTAAAHEPAKVRQAKRKASSEAQAKLNAKLSWQKLERMLAANFGPGDLVVTLTFDDDHLPKNREEARTRLKRFRGNMAEARRRKNAVFRCVYCIENKHENGRWHYHLVINTTGDDYRDILSCWPYAANIEIHQLEINRDRNYETLARYMCKERPDTPRQHVWGYTRNCEKPVHDSRRVPDDTVLQLPEGAMLIAHEIKTTEFGRFEYLKYLLIGQLNLMQKAKPKARRKPRKR